MVRQGSGVAVRCASQRGALSGEGCRRHARYGKGRSALPAGGRPGLSQIDVRIGQSLHCRTRGAEGETKGAGLCRQGADLGEANAQTDLGNLYLQGVGVPKDIVQARYWYELAAAQGQPNAQFVLGQIYWKGDGVTRSQAKAATFLKAAFKGGRRDAAPLLARWLFADWMSEHKRGDFTILDEAIGYQKVALGSATEKSRGDEQTLLDLMLAARGTAEKEQ